MWDHETIMMIVQGVGETLYMTVLSTVLGYLFGLPMGVLLAVSDKEGLKPMQCCIRYWMPLQTL